MIRKKLIAAVAISSIVLGNTVVPAIAAVYHNTGVADAPGSGLMQEANHYVLKCRTVSVQTYYGWKKKRVCKKVYPKHYQSY